VAARAVPQPDGGILLARRAGSCLPARRVIPGLAGLDLATLLLAWALQALGLWSQALIMGAEPSALALIAVAGVDLIRYSVYILVFAVFVQVAISWINPSAAGTAFRSRDGGLSCGRCDALCRRSAASTSRRSCWLVICNVLLIPLNHLRLAAAGL